MPLHYNKYRTTTVYGPTENELKKRNNTVRKVLNAKGIPRNMGNKEILRRVKVYNNMMSTLPFHPRKLGNPPDIGKHLMSNNVKHKISNFISNGRVFNERKRKALAELMLNFNGPPVMEILALKNEDVIRYIKMCLRVFTASFTNYKWAPPPLHELTYKGMKGPIREDPAAVRVLKKRTAFLKEMLKVQNPHNGSVMIKDLPRNMRNKIPLPPYGFLSMGSIWRYMLKEFPLPPHPKNAATKIQSAVRGMRNRKKLTTMRKAATTIQKRARGMINRTTVKKMKTVAGKRKASTSIKTTSAKRTKTKR